MRGLRQRLGSAAGLGRRAAGFARDERGDMLTLGLFWAVIMLMVGGFTVDYLNATALRTRLQNTADSTAQAALLSRQTESVDKADAAAVTVAEGNMPVAQYGDVVTADDITFGTWDADTATFTADPNSTSAVRVVSQMTTSRGNAARTYLLSLIGVTHWDIRRASIYETYQKSCLMQGFVSQGLLDLQSNNTYFNGFCLHSNDHVEINSGNSFSSGAVVSMPDISQIVLPSSGFDSNPGLEAALRNDRYNIRILDELPSIITDLAEGAPSVTPDYVTNPAINQLQTANVAQGDLKEGQINTYLCNGNQTLSIGQDVVVSNTVLVTNCKVQFKQGVVLENAVVATTNTDKKSITSPSGLQVGKDDNCATGGGAQVLTMGGMDFPANLSLYGGQLIAEGDISFSANANGIQGAAMVAGGDISGTSNMSMATCDTGMEQNFEAPYFRLAD